MSGAPGLVREVGRWAFVALMINGIIGAGIFGLPSRVHALVGPWGLLAFVACGALISCIVLCFAEVSSRFERTGGPYLYARQAFGPLAGFVIGWLAWLSRVSALAVIADVMASYLAHFWSPAGTAAGRAVAISLAMVALTAINVVGVGRTSKVVNALTVGKLIPLLLFVGVGLFFIDMKNYAGAPPPDLEPFSRAVFALVFAFGGFEAVVVAAGEAKDPQRNVPFALLVAIGIATVLYILIQAVCIGTLPGLADTAKPLADASGRFMGSGGGSLIAAGALLSTLGTLAATILVAPRLVFAMSEEHQLPGAFGVIHPRFRTPHLAIVLSGAIGLALALSGTFSYLVNLNVITRLLAYSATAAALVVFRVRDRERPARFHVPGGPVLAAIAIGACLYLLVRTPVRDLRDVGIAVAFGMAVHLIERMRRKR